MCKTSKTPDVHIPNIITPKEIFQKFITVCFNDKMRQLYFKTTKLFKILNPFHVRRKKNLPIFSFRYFSQKKQVRAKNLHINQKTEKERESSTQESKLSPINSNENAIIALGLFGKL